MHNVIVTWHVAGQTTPHRSRVLLVDDYSTTEDIPKILAIAHLGGVHDAGLVVVDDVQPEA